MSQLITILFFDILLEGETKTGTVFSSPKLDFVTFANNSVIMLYLFGISINFFLILLLFSKKGKTVADKFLLAWLIVICCHLLLFVAATTFTGSKYPEVHVVAPLFPLLHGPLLYLYTAAMTNMLPANKIKWALHFLPFLIVSIVMTPFFMLSTEEKGVVVDSGGKGYEIQLSINYFAILISGIVYVIWLLILLGKHKKNIANQFSNDEKIKLNWLRYLIYGLGIIWIIIIAQTVNEKSYDDYIFGAVVLIVVVIGYFGIKQGRIYSTTTIQPLKTDAENITKDESTNIPFTEETSSAEIFEEKPVLEVEQKEDILLKKKYAKSGLSEVASQELHDKLTSLMQQEKVYTEPELTLAALAQKLNVHPNYLSQVINEKEGKTFYDYINTLRVQEFIRIVLIPENSKFTMMSMAADCGFNSKSSFNKNFKKVIGQSPSEYLNKMPRE